MTTTDTITMTEIRLAGTLDDEHLRVTIWGKAGWLQDLQVPDHQRCR